MEHNIVDVNILCYLLVSHFIDPGHAAVFARFPLMFIGVPLVFHWCSLVFHWCSLVFIDVPMAFVGAQLVWCFRQYLSN